MGYIREKMLIKGNKGTEELNVLVDSGAKQSYIRKDKAEKICDINYYDEPKPVTLADGITQVKDVGYCHFDTKIEDKAIYDEMDVLEIPEIDDKPEMFIGAQTLEKFNLKLIFQGKGKKSYIDTSEYDSAFYWF